MFSELPCWPGGCCQWTNDIHTCQTILLCSLFNLKLVHWRTELGYPLPWRITCTHLHHPLPSTTPSHLPPHPHPLPVKRVILMFMRVCAYLYTHEKSNTFGVFCPCMLPQSISSTAITMKLQQRYSALKAQCLNFIGIIWHEMEYKLNMFLNRLSHQK